jgi:segregation and condensation protein A
MSIEIRLEKFEGPLDLLLHLIKTNEMDIYDIPMVDITEQYLAIIDQMKQLNLDIAGEFLLMAATLIHIKSRLLLPANDEITDEPDEDDPRAELVRRLLEYQRYKEASRVLEESPRASSPNACCASPTSHCRA